MKKWLNKNWAVISVSILAAGLLVGVGIFTWKHILESAKIETEKTEETFMHREIAERCKGRIPYYQIFNETDVYSLKNEDNSLYNEGDGNVIEHFNPVRVKEMVEKTARSTEVF